MEKLVFINACIRKENSRTLRLAEELMTALEQRYEITRIDLTEQPMEPVTADLFHRRGTAGISEEDINYVFERFYKSDKSRGLNKSGAGLGLFISKTIMEAHGQKIWVDSDYGKNCCFSFTLDAE